MTEEEAKLLAVFEVRVHDLIALCEEHKKQIAELESSLAKKEEALQEALVQIRELNTKYGNLLTARVVSVTEGDMRKAKMRLSKLVREVDKCIALLAE